MREKLLAILLVLIFPKYGYGKYHREMDLLGNGSYYEYYPEDY